MNEQHPWHLHGHSFWVLGAGPGEWPGAAAAQAAQAQSPPYKDSVTLPPASWVWLRFIADNPVRSSRTHVTADQNLLTTETSCSASQLVCLTMLLSYLPQGVWPLHCHIVWHLNMGMGVIFAIGSQQEPAAASRPPVGKERRIPDPPASNELPSVLSAAWRQPPAATG